MQAAGRGGIARRRVVAFDACERLVSLARQHSGLPIAQRDFSQVNEIACYDGVWACASLLHLPEKELAEACSASGKRSSLAVFSISVSRKVRESASTADVISPTPRKAV